MEGLTEGRIVHYVLDRGHSQGQHRPAIVVKLWSDHGGEFPHPVQLQVFTDGSNDGQEFSSGIIWRTSVPYSEEPHPNTWHWIEKA